MDIRIDDLSGLEIKQLLLEHLNDMFATSPAESVHALDLSELRKADICFWTVWTTDNSQTKAANNNTKQQLLGCGALKTIDAKHGEIKSMRTTNAARNKGVASTLLSHILNVATQQGLGTVSLETGSMDFFEPARKLYIKHGFDYCEPFAGYELDPNSVYMAKTLNNT